MKGGEGGEALAWPPLTAPHPSWFQSYLSITIDGENRRKTQQVKRAGVVGVGRDPTRDSGKSQEFSLSGTIPPVSLWSLLLSKIRAKWENAASAKWKRSKSCRFSFQSFRSGRKIKR